MALKGEKMFDEYYDELEESMKEDEQNRYSQTQDDTLRILGINTQTDLNKLKRVIKILLEVLK